MEARPLAGHLDGTKCDRASVQAVVANQTVFLESELQKAVLTGADCRGADFRWRSWIVRIDGAQIEGARSGKPKAFPRK